MTPEIIVPVVLLGFLVAIGVPVVLIIKKLFWRPSEKIPDFNTRQQRSGEFFEPHITSQALKIFQECWKEYIDDRDIKKVLDQVNIFWKKDPIHLGQEFIINGHKVSMASGLTRTKKDIDVWIYDHFRRQINGDNVVLRKEKEEIKISDTAFAHELIHITLWHLEGEPDADHEDDYYSGWTKKHTEVERQTNLRLKQKGL